MNKKIAWILLTLSLFAVLAGINAYAQSTNKVKANIPFGFRVGNQSFPAGEYVVVPLQPRLVVIQSKDGHQSAAAQSIAVQAKKRSDNGKLVFNRYGVMYFLSQIWTPGEEVGRKLPKSKVEIEVAQGALPEESTILVAGPVKK